MHVVKVSSKGQIVIPKEVRTRHRLDRDTDLVLLESGEALVLRKKAEGRLPKPSEIRPLKLFSIHRALVHTLVGRVSDETLGRVTALLVALLPRGRRPRTSA